MANCFAVEVMWSFQESLLSIETPRHVAFDFMASGTPHRVIAGSGPMNCFGDHQGRFERMY